MFQEKVYHPRRFYIFILLPLPALLSFLVNGIASYLLSLFWLAGLYGLKYSRFSLKTLPWKVLKTCPYLLLFLIWVETALLVQKDWQGFILQSVWLFSLVGYYFIFKDLPPLFVRRKKNFGGMYDFPGRIPKNDWTRKIWIPLLLAVHSIVYLLFLEFPLYWYLKESLHLPWALVPLGGAELSILFSGSLLVGTYWVQVEYRLKRNFSSFVAKIVLWVSSWIGLLLFAPMIIVIFLLFVLILVIQFAEGDRHDKAADRQFLKIKGGMIFIIFILIVFLSPMRWWQWMGVDAEEWFVAESKIIKSEPLKAGEASVITLEITNGGKRTWYPVENELYLDLQIVDTYYGETRSGLPVTVEIPRLMKTGESFLTQVKLPVPFWFKKGGLLVQLKHRQMGSDFLQGNVQYLVIGFSRSFSRQIRISPGLNQLIEEDLSGVNTIGSNPPKHHEITSIRHILSDTLDHVLKEPLWGQGRQLTLTWKHGDYLLWISMFGIPAGFFMVFMMLNGFFFVTDIAFKSSPGIKNKYLWAAFVVILLSGNFFYFPLTRAGNLVVLFVLSRLKIEQPVKRTGFSLY